MLGLPRVERLAGEKAVPVAEQLLGLPQDVERRGDDEVVVVVPETFVTPQEVLGGDLGRREDHPSVHLAPRHDIALGIVAAVLDPDQGLVDRLLLQVDERQPVHLGDRLVVIDRPHQSERDDGLRETRPPFGRLSHGDGEPGESEGLFCDQQLGDIEMQPFAGRTLARNPEEFRRIALETASHRVCHAPSERGQQ